MVNTKNKIEANAYVGGVELAGCAPNCSSSFMDLATELMASTRERGSSSSRGNGASSKATLRSITSSTVMARLRSGFGGGTCSEK